MPLRTIAAAIVACFLCQPAWAGCSIPVPVSDSVARAGSADLHGLFRNALRHHERHLDIQQHKALSAGYHQRIPAALSPRPAGAFYESRLATAGATSSVLSAASQGSILRNVPGNRIGTLDPSNPGNLVSSLLNDLIGALLSQLHPALRPFARQFLQTAGLPAQGPPPRPRYLESSPTARELMRHRNYPIQTPQGTALLSGTEAIYYLDHRSNGLHHPADEILVTLDNDSATLLPLSEVYRQLSALGVHHAYALGNRQPLPWPPRILEPTERLALDTLGIAIPAGYGYLRPLPPDQLALRLLSSQIADRLLAAPTTARLPDFGPTARSLRRCATQPSCDTERLRRILAADGHRSAHTIAPRLHAPIAFIFDQLDLHPYRPPPPPHPGHAAMLALQIGTPPASSWRPQAPPSAATPFLLDSATSGEPTPADHLFATPLQTPLDQQQVAEARDATLRSVMLDSLAHASVSHFRNLDVDSAAIAIRERWAACESSACTMRAWYDSLHATAEALSIQARLELTLLEQSLTTITATSRPVPPARIP